MKDHEIIELYWARNESAIAATAEKYGNYCHTIAYNISLPFYPSDCTVQRGTETGSE